MRINPNEIIGKKFSMLTVKRYYGFKISHDRKRHFYQCECNCGQTSIVERDTLISLGTKSCGCLTHKKGKDNKNWKGFGNISGLYWSSIKCRTRYKKIEFNITIKYAWEIWESQNGYCALTGLPISLLEDQTTDCKRTASLDRIDNNKGYITGNIQWVHKDINRIKSNLHQDKFIKLCLLIKKNIIEGAEYESK